MWAFKGRKLKEKLLSYVSEKYRNNMKKYLNFFKEKKNFFDNLLSHTGEKIK